MMNNRLRTALLELAIAYIKSEIPKVDSMSRVAIIDDIRAGYCPDCCGDDLPCYCERDE